MEEIISKIFTEGNFKSYSADSNWTFFESSAETQPSYYLVHHIETNTLTKYLDSENFDQLLAKFDELKARKSDIDKNTSLLVCAKSEKIEDAMELHKNDVLAIEEDEFWFKKYVLIYSEEAITEFRPCSNLIDALTKKLLNKEMFWKYREGQDENESYFLTIQLFLKLSFLEVPVTTEQKFESVNSILTSKLDQKEINFLHSVVDDLEINDDYWEELKHTATNVSHNLFDKFIDKFSSHV